MYRYNAQLAISCLRGSVGRTREYCTLIFLSSALLVRIPYATYIIVTIEKTRGKICIEYSDVTNYNCNRRGLLTIKGNPAFRQVNKRGYW